jgi:galactose mutarotase-like enzyme
MSQILLKSGLNELIIEPNSGQLVQWIHNSVGVFYQGSSIRRSGIPILFPFANPLKDDILQISGMEIKQHGFGRDFPWQIGKRTESSIEIILTPKDISSEMQEAYPFDFEAKIVLELNDNNLIYTLEITNHGKQTMPIAPGIHPYFPIKHADKANLVIDNLQAFDAKNINWDNESTGYFYGFEDSVDIKFTNHTISMQQRTIKNFKHLVIWSQTNANLDYDFVCVEPFSRHTNAINNDPILVEPGRVWISKITFTIK